MWCLHGGPPRWWTSGGQKFGCCQICGKILFRGAKKKLPSEKPSPEAEGQKQLPQGQLPLPLGRE